ncbi:MAG: hypothetical protein WAT46_04915 [Saprospiraceae bacterium]
MYGVLGYIVETANETEMKDFIIRQFLGNIPLPEDKRRAQNIAAQLELLLTQRGMNKAKVKISAEAELHKAEVWSGDKILATHISKSPVYAKKKAIKLALIQLSEAYQNKLQQDAEYRNILLKKEEQARLARKAENENRHQQFLEKQNQKKEARKEKVRQKLMHNQEQDKLRRAAKAKKKLLMEAKEKRANQIEAKPINAGKRRYLEDKKK